jgi:hypothetical protein
MDSDYRLHGNIGGTGSVVPVVDHVTGEPIAWVPRQAAARVVQLAGRVFHTEQTPDAIRVQERAKAGDTGTLRYATKKAPLMRSALRHLALGLGLSDRAVVHGQLGWTHFGGSLYAAMLGALGVPGGALSSEDDPRLVNLDGLAEACKQRWESLEMLFGFGPFQRQLPTELRREAVADSLPVESFRAWIRSLEEVRLSTDQERVLYGT